MTARKREETIIYGLIEPDTGQLRYVGKTQYTLGHRLSGHISHSKKAKTRCEKWIFSLVRRGLRPEIELLELVPAGGDWIEAEQFWIQNFKALGCRLVNMAPGGESNAYSPTAEEREKYRELATMRMKTPEAQEASRRGGLKTWEDPERRAHLIAVLRLKSKDPAYIARQSEARLALWATAEYRNKVVAAQQQVDRTAIAKDFWLRPEYRERQAVARAARHARGWSTPKSSAG